MPAKQQWNSGGNGIIRPDPARMLAEQRSFGGARFWSALAATLLIHAVVIGLMPARLFHAGERTVAEQRPLRVEIVPAEAEEPEQFTQTNPAVPANPPDETPFFSDRDQQAAQPEPDDGDPSTPTVEDDFPEPTQNLVRGDSHAVPEEVEQWLEGGGDGLDSLPKQRAIPQFSPPDGGEGIAVPVAPEIEQPLENATMHVPVDGGGAAPSELEGSESLEQPEVLPPRPRPVLPQFLNGPVGPRHGAAPRLGRVAVDANFSEFGDYIARMLDVIIRQWHILAWDSLGAAERGTMVSISFRIDLHGQVHSLEVQESTASLTGTLICQDAIESRQPFGPWTQEMRQVLGDEQTIRIRFFYQ